MSEGKFYWIKLQEDFFDSDVIQWIEEQPNGKEYVLFYLKMCLKSLKNDGILIRAVGDMLIPYSPDKLATLTNTNVDTVITALMVLQKANLIELLEDGSFKIPSVVGAVGSTAKNSHALRQARYRERQKALGSVTRVTPSVTSRGVTNSNVEIEYRDKDINKEKDISAVVVNTNNISKGSDSSYNPILEVQKKLKLLSLSEYQTSLFLGLYQEVGQVIFDKALVKAARKNANNFNYVEKAARGIAAGNDFDEKPRSGGLDFEAALRNIKD